MCTLLSTPTMIFMIKLFVIQYMMNKTHVINNLMILEYVAMAVLFISFKAISYFSMELYLVFFMLILMITESILGLAILISLIRTHSNDYIKSSMVSLF